MNFTDVIAEAECEEQEYYEQYRAVYEAYVTANTPAPPLRPTRSIHCYIPRDREGANKRLVADYLFDQPRFSEDYFRRRFCMSKRLFMRIINKFPPVLNTFNHLETQPVGKVSRRYRSVLVPSDNLLMGKRMTSSTSICMWVSQLESYSSKIFATSFVLLSVRNSFGHPPPKIVKNSQRFFRYAWQY